MVWLGLVIGVLLGFDSNSITGFIGWVAAGWFVGHVLGRLLNYLLPDKKESEGTHTHTQAEAWKALQQRLEHRISFMQKQMDTLAQRLAYLERLNNVGNEGSVHSHADATTHPADAHLSSTETDASSSQPHAVNAYDPALPPVVQPAQVAPLGELPLDAVPPPAQVVFSKPIAGSSASARISSGASSHVSSSDAVHTDGAEVSSDTEQKQASHTAPDMPQRPRPMPAAPMPQSQPSWLEDIWQRWIIGGNPLVKVGVLILFLGLAFLLRFAAEHAVFPVEWRYVSVAVAALGLLVAGWRWREREDNYGLILQGAGIGVLYLTTLASMKLHELIAPGWAFAILFAVAACAAFLAILQNSLALAVAGTLGGFAAPVLASTGSGNHIALFSYLTVLNVGIVAIAWFKAWRLLNAIGFLCTFALGSAWAAKYYHEELFSTTEPFVLLLFALYVLITFLFAKRTLAAVSEGASTGEGAEGSDASLERQMRKSMAHVDYVDGLLVFGVPVATFGWQYLLVEHTQYGAAFSALGFGLAYIFLAYGLFSHSGKRYALLTETLIALAVIFGSLAIPLALESAWTSAAWSIEAAGIYWVGRRQRRVHARMFALLLLGGSIFSFATGVGIGYGNSVLQGSWLGCIVLAASSAWIVWQMNKGAQESLHEFEKGMRPAVVAVTAFFMGLMPFLVWPLEWAAPALAGVGALAVIGAFQLPSWALLWWGCAYQALAGFLFFTTLFSSHAGLDSAIAPSRFWGALLIALAAFVSAWTLHASRRPQQANTASAAMPSSAVILGWAIFWWAIAWVNESQRIVPMEFTSAFLVGIAMVSAWVLSGLAHRLSWPQIGQASLAYLPALAFIALASDSRHPLAGWGVVAWPLALVIHGLLLQRQAFWIAGTKVERLAHIIGVWLFVGLAAAELRWQFANLSDPDSAWYLLGWVIAPVAYLWLMIWPQVQAHWPVRDYQRSYRVTAALPLVVYVIGWVWISNIASHGAAWPLPYIPLLNPLEMAHLAVIVGCAGWGWSVRDDIHWDENKPVLTVIAASTVWAVLTGIVARTCHHWGGIPWSVDALFSSSLVQASLSIVWSAVAIALMVSVHRHKQRWIWMVGASLLALVVVKLFMVELAAKGSVARIVSFIVVGMLLLLVGYFAPLPPKPASSRNDSSAD